jgi:hypothetical protein
MTQTGQFRHRGESDGPGAGGRGGSGLPGRSAAGLRA